MKKSSYPNTVLLLAAALLLCVGCGDTQTDEVPSSVTDTEAPVVTDAPDYVLAEKDYAGEPFIVYAGAGYNESFATEENGEPLNDAKFQMVRTVEEAYNVDISEHIVDFWGMKQSTEQLILSGDTTFDSVATMDMYALQLAMEGCFIPLQDVDAVQEDQPWWGGDVTRQLTIANNLYYAVAPINLWGYRQTACMLMNATMAGSLDMEIPYDDVFSGTWTMDDLLAMQGVATKDLNGDGTMGTEDAYTFGVSDIRRFVQFIWSGCDGRYIEKNADDMPYLAVFDNEKYVNVINMCYNLVYSGVDKVTQYVNTEDASGANLSNFTQFCEGKILITTAFVGHLLNSDIRNMKDDFAVLPMPKYDESQISYQSWGDDPTFFMIPTTQDDVEFSGAILDGLACVAYYDLLPVMIDTALKDKMSRDVESKEVIQLCFDTRFVDIGEFALDQFFYAHEKLMNGTDTVVSNIEKNRKKIEKQLANIVTVFTES